VALIDNWKSAPRMLVVQTLAIIAIVQAVWVELPQDLVQKLPEHFVHYMTSALAVLGIVVRVLKQQGLLPPEVEAQKQAGFARPGLLLPLAVALLIGCTTMGMPKPKTFDDNVAVSLISVTQVRKATGVLLAAGKITAADAQNVQNQADVAREGINVARAISATDPTAAQTKLTAAITVLQALDAYLASKGTP
jgi:hypothetical protein